MALIKVSALISDIRGKIAGSVFQLSNSGLTLRSNPGQINPQSPSQNSARAITGSVLREWIQLTAAQRARWELFRQYNPILQRNISGLHISAQAMFTKINVIRLHYNLTILTAPSFNKCDLTPIDATLQFSGGAIEIVTDRVMNSSIEFVILSTSPILAASINNPGKSMRLISFTTTSTDTFDITSQYLDIFGQVPQPGDNVFIRFTVANKQSGLFLPFIIKPQTL